MIEDLNKELPLIIETISWDTNSLLIQGIDWWFRVDTAWRLVDKQRVFGGDDEEIHDKLSKIKIFEKVVKQSQFVNDPALIFNNNLIIEVFSTDMKPEMWVAITPNNIIYESFCDKSPH